MDGTRAIEPIVTTNPPSGKGEKAAREFEAILLTSLLEALQKSFAFDPKDSSPGCNEYRELGSQALAGAMANGGGIGIARLILQHLPAPKGPVPR